MSIPPPKPRHSNRHTAVHFRSTDINELVENKPIPGVSGKLLATIIVTTIISVSSVLGAYFLQVGKLDRIAITQDYMNRDLIELKQRLNSLQENRQHTLTYKPVDSNCNISSSMALRECFANE